MAKPHAQTFTPEAVQTVSPWAVECFRVPGCRASGRRLRRAHPGLFHWAADHWLVQKSTQAAASFLLKQRAAMLAAERMDSKAGSSSKGLASSASRGSYKAAQAAVKPSLHRAVDTLPGPFFVSKA